MDKAEGKPSLPNYQNTMEKFLDVKSMIEEMQKNPNEIAVAVSILVGILTVLLLLVWSRKGLRKLQRNAVLILGPCYAGKTLLFSQLMHGMQIETFTSIKENVGQYSGRKKDDDGDSRNKRFSKKMSLYDIPGHYRLRYSALEKRREEAKAIVYVIDASTIKHRLRDAAEFLFNILRDSCLHPAGIPVLVVCNKQDMGIQAKGAKAIERELEKEINHLRETKSKLLEDSSGNTSKHSKIYLGKEGKFFEFSDLNTEVKFVEASAAKDCDDKDSGMAKIRQWIATKA